MTTDIGGNLTGDNVNINSSQIFHGDVYFGGREVERPPQRKNQIFLSYGRHDDSADYRDPAKSFMRRLYNDLSAQGYDVWWDRENMPSRALTFLQEIQDAITPCRLLILVVGEDALESDYVRAEWEFALQRCIPVVPILRNGTYDSLPAEIKNYHAPDFCLDENYDSALTELKRVLGEPDAPLSTLYGVPTLPPSYIEREAMDEVHTQLLIDTEKPLVVSARQQTMTLYGMGGIGKTTLVAALSRTCDVRRAFPDGLFWLEMGKSADVLTRMGDIGVAFGDSRQEYPDLARARSRLGAVLSGKRVLIVLDDVWNHQHAEAFRVVDSGCRLLITTRQSGITTKLDAQGIQLDVLTETEALTLIAERLQIEPGSLPAECVAIVQIVGRHTLAVSLAAAQLHESGMDYAPRLLKRLQEGKVFKTLKLDEDDKNLNLEKCLFLSYDDLTDDIKRRFRAVGIFVLEGTFDEAAAGSIWGDEDADDTLDALTHLVRVGLIQRVRGNRYNQHGLLRAYAHALLDAENETQATFNRYADYVIEQAEQFWRLPPQDWGQLDPLLPHVDFVGAQLVRLWQTAENPNEVLIQRCGDFVWYAMHYVNNRKQILQTTNGNVLRGMDWLEMGLQVYQSQNEQFKSATLFNNIGAAWADLGEQQKALDYYGQALTLFRVVGNRSSEASALNNIGRTRVDLGEYRDALNFYDQALNLFRVEVDRDGEATTLTNIGLAWANLGEYRKALDSYEAALPIHRKTGNQIGIASTLNCIGGAWSGLCDYHKALYYYERALPLQKSICDRRGEAATLNNMGAICSELGEHQKALNYYEQSLPLRRAVGDISGEATTLNNMSYIYFQNGDVGKTIIIQQKIIDLAHSKGTVAEEAVYLYNIAVVYRQIGRLTEAIQAAEAGRDILMRYSLPQNAGGTTIGKYDALLANLRSEPTTPNTLPREKVEQLVNNTFAVMTQSSDHLSEWQSQLRSLVEQAKQNNDPYPQAFFGALLNITNGLDVFLTPDNPYADVVQQVVDAIKQYHSDDSAGG